MAVAGAVVCPSTIFLTVVEVELLPTMPATWSRQVAHLDPAGSSSLIALLLVDQPFS
jgi:hypothetical protein